MNIELPEFLILTAIIFAVVFAGMHFRRRRKRQ
jgi:hypothetical protein